MATFLGNLGSFAEGTHNEDIIYLLDGNDSVTATNATPEVYGGDGNDTIFHTVREARSSTAAAATIMLSSAHQYPHHQ